MLRPVAKTTFAQRLRHFMDRYSLFQHFLRCYTTHYADFTGRARRREYWGFTLFYVLFFLALYLPMLVAGAYGIVANIPALLFVAAGFWVVLQLGSAASIVPSLSVATRRLHDTGRSGWWQLLAYVPFLGYMILILGIQMVVTLPVFLVTRPTGWLIVFGLLFLALLVGTIWLLVLLCLKGSPEDNAYGPTPLAPPAEA